MLEDDGHDRRDIDEALFLSMEIFRSGWHRYRYHKLDEIGQFVVYVFILRIYTFFASFSGYKRVAYVSCVDPWCEE